MNEERNIHCMLTHQQVKKNRFFEMTKKMTNI